MTHPTPWRREGDRVIDADGNEVIATQDVRDQIFNAVNAHAYLVKALAGIEIKGPDADGLLWLVINGATKKAMFNIGRATGVAAEAAVLFEQTRKAALAKAGAA